MSSHDADEGGVDSATLSDYALLAAATAFASTLSGPLAVLFLAAAAAHVLLFGRPRASLGGVYACLGLAAQAFRLDGLEAWSGAAQLAARAALVGSAALSLLVDRVVCPLRGRVARATGPHDTALCVVGAADILLRIYYPTPRKSARARVIEMARRGALGSAAPLQPAAPVPYLLHGPEVVTGLADALGYSSLAVSWLAQTRPWCLEGDPALTRAALPSATSGGFRVVVLSHSLSSTPDIYGSLIAELVSHGFVVAAVEHADGSAAFARIENNRSQPFLHLTSAERASRRLEYKMRRSQLSQRVGELRSAADLMESIATVGFSEASDEKEDMQLARLLLHGAISKTAPLVALGHSFGGGTCIAAAEQDRRFGCVVALDPWLFPLSSVTLSRGLATVPVLTILGESWWNSAEHMTGLRLLFDVSMREKYVRAPGGRAGAKGAASPGQDDEDGEDGLNIVGSNGVAADGTVSEPFFVRSTAVSPASVVIGLKGLRHYSFVDLALLAERLMRWQGFIGRRPALDAHRLVCALLLGYLAEQRWFKKAERFAVPPGLAGEVLLWKQAL